MAMPFPANCPAYGLGFCTLFRFEEQSFGQFVLDLGRVGNTGQCNGQDKQECSQGQAQQQVAPVGCRQESLPGQALIVVVFCFGFRLARLGCPLAVEG